MLKKLFEAIHGRVESRKQEKAVMAGVEQIIRSKCPDLILTHKNRRLLLDAVDAAMRHFSGLIDQIPGPVVLTPDKWEADPVLNALFVGSNAIRETLQTSKPLNNFFKQSPEPEAAALLAAAWNEKTVFGTAKESGIVRRGVPQLAISFENHRLIAPASDLPMAKTALQQEALVCLCRNAFSETRDLRQWQAELEKQRDLLAFKLQPAKAGGSNQENAEVKQVLDEINGKIRSIKNELGTSESNFRYILRILNKPQDLLTFEVAALQLSRLGIVLNGVPDSWANELTLAKYEIGELPPQGAIWVTVNRDTMEK